MVSFYSLIFWNISIRNIAKILKARPWLNKVIKSTEEASSYAIKNICLEFDMVSDPEITQQIRQPYSGKMVILYDRILRHRKSKKKSDNLWNFNLIVPAQSMKGILMLFEDPDRTSTELYYNLKLKK